LTAIVCLTSTVGFEAIQRGVPVILLGRCFYENYEGVRRVESWSELERVVRSLECGRPHEANPRPMARYLKCCFSGHFNTLSETVASGSNIQSLMVPLRQVLSQGANINES
jgi:hypothetical protein